MESIDFRVFPYGTYSLLMTSTSSLNVTDFINGRSESVLFKRSRSKSPRFTFYRLKSRVVKDFNAHVGLLSHVESYKVRPGVPFRFDLEGTEVEGLFKQVSGRRDEGVRLLRRTRSFRKDSGLVFQGEENSGNIGLVKRSVHRLRQIGLT